MAQLGPEQQSSPDGQSCVTIEISKMGHTHTYSLSLSPSKRMRNPGTRERKKEKKKYLYLCRLAFAARIHVPRRAEHPCGEGKLGASRRVQERPPLEKGRRWARCHQNRQERENDAGSGCHNYVALKRRSKRGDPEGLSPQGEGEDRVKARRTRTSETQIHTHTHKVYDVL